ncbi:MAG: IS1182 family transposase [Cyanobacteria bacterium J06627_8]
MSLKPQSYQVPEETKRVAKAIYPEGNRYMRWYDEFGLIFNDEDFRHLYPDDGQPALSPVRMCTVLILQFAANLSDRQVTEAIKTRIDWKYLLCLELTDQGFHYSVLSEFRKRLLQDATLEMLFNKLLGRFIESELLKSRGTQRTDSTKVLASIRTLNRIELVGETLRAALNSLAVVHPSWVQSHIDASWAERYGERIDDFSYPQTEAEQAIYVEQLGADGLYVLEKICQVDSPTWLREIPSIQLLHRVWIQNFTGVADTPDRLRWRDKKECPPGHLAIRSPHDPEARLSRKRQMTWVGYKVHLTEVCDSDQPHFITHVTTTPATLPDNKVTNDVHNSLARKQLTPAVHLVDQAYIDADLLLSSTNDFDVDLCGPVRQDTSWQAREQNGFSSDDFVIDWERQVATCPAGETSLHWLPAKSTGGKDIIQIKFSKKVCRVCDFQSQCTRSKPPRRSITVFAQAQHFARQLARERMETDEFKAQYAQRAGIEGAISEAANAHGMRRNRYRGLSKTHLQHIFTAMAINLKRATNWLMGVSVAQTRSSPFVQLYAH